jgi:hypothetical protein
MLTSILHYATRYDELLEHSSAGFWASLQREPELSQPTEELTMSILRYYNNVFFVFFLYKWGRIPTKLWKLILPAVRRRLRSPALFESGSCCKRNSNTCRNSQYSFAMCSTGLP